MKRYFVITETRTDLTPRILLKAEGPQIKAWLAVEQAWGDWQWGYDYCYGDRRNEATEITAESAEQMKSCSTLVNPDNVGGPIESSGGTATPSMSGMSAKQILDALGLEAGSHRQPSAPKTAYTIYASMLEQDVSYEVDSPTVRLRTAYLTGEISDAQYKEVFDLLQEPAVEE